MAFVARSISEIEAALIADKESRPELAGLTSTSQTARWRIWTSLIATQIHIHETSLELFQTEVEERALEIQSGTLPWYAFESLKFQYGDSLEFLDGNITYSVIDEDKQIVVFAAADFEAGYVVIKAAKDDGSGFATPLEALELDALREYWGQKKFAQTAVSIVSESGDVAQVHYRVGVDGSILNQSTGESLITPGLFPVTNAINLHLQGFQAERFNSIFRIQGLTDAIQSVTGVINTVPTSVLIKPYNGAFTEVLDDINHQYLARAGWIVEDPGTPISSTLTYYNG